MNNTNINELAQQLRDAAKTSLSAPEFGSSDVAGITRLRLMKPFVDLSRPKNILAILDALEAAQQYAKSRDEENQDLMLTVGRLRVEREQLEASQPVVPEGWKLVPIEPTPDMIAAGDECWMMTESCADWVSDMDYSKLSDFEINTLVAKLTGNYGSCEPVFNVVFRSSGTEFNPINRPEQAWPIIERNKISLVYVNNEWSARQYHNACIEICGKSAFKCAMIVFLMMNDEAH